MMNLETKQKLKDSLLNVLSDPNTQTGTRYKVGKLGYKVDGQFRVVPANNTARAYVRYDDGSWALIHHKDNVRLLNQAIEKNDYTAVKSLPVIIMQDFRGNDYIAEIDYEQYDAFAETANTTAGEIGGVSASTDPINASIITVTHSEGMTFYVSTGVYYDPDYQWWKGQYIQLDKAGADKRPSTSGHHWWVVVCIDPSASPHSLILVTPASSQSTRIPLDKSKIDTAPFEAAGYIPIAAISAENGQTDGSLSQIVLLNSGHRLPGIGIEDARYWLGAADTRLSNAHDLSTITTGLIGHTSGTPRDATTGDIAEPFGAVAANRLYASPDGSAGSPTFRALVGDDIPWGNPTSIIGASNQVAGYFSKLRVDGAAGTIRDLEYMTSGVLRWRILADSASESGSSAGSDLRFTPYDDAGNSLGVSAIVTRVNGNWLFPNNVKIGAGTDPNEALDIEGNMRIDGPAPYIQLYQSGVLQGQIGIDFSTSEFYIGNDARIDGAIDVSGAATIGGLATINNRLDVYRAVTGGGGLLQIWQSDEGGIQTTVARVQTDGDIQNVNNSYGAISDEKYKSNIRPAPDYLADLMQVRIRKFENILASGETQLGVVAQELETIFPRLVEAYQDPTDDTQTAKSVKYSVLSLIGVKALQELKTEVDNLEARITALEGI